jgi:hypothetical protein
MIKIINLINVNYPDTDYIPRWVDSVKFKDDMKRRVYSELHYQLQKLLLSIDSYDELYDEDIRILNIDKLLLVFPFTAYTELTSITDTLYDKLDTDYFNNIENTIYLSDGLINVLKEIVALFDGFDDNFFVIEQILFMRDHTWKYGDASLYLM